MRHPPAQRPPSRAEHAAPATAIHLSTYAMLTLPTLGARPHDGLADQGCLAQLSRLLTSAPCLPTLACRMSRSPFKLSFPKPAPRTTAGSTSASALHSAPVDEAVIPSSEAGSAPASAASRTLTQQGASAPKSGAGTPSPVRSRVAATSTTPNNAAPRLPPRPARRGAAVPGTRQSTDSPAVAGAQQRGGSTGWPYPPVQGIPHYMLSCPAPGFGLAARAQADAILAAGTVASPSSTAPAAPAAVVGSQHYGKPWCEYLISRMRDYLVGRISYAELIQASSDEGTIRVLEVLADIAELATTPTAPFSCSQDIDVDKLRATAEQLKQQGEHWQVLPLLCRVAHKVVSQGGAEHPEALAAVRDVIDAFSMCGGSHASFYVYLPPRAARADQWGLRHPDLKRLVQRATYDELLKPEGPCKDKDLLRIVTDIAQQLPGGLGWGKAVVAPLQDVEEYNKHANMQVDAVETFMRGDVEAAEAMLRRCVAYYEQFGPHWLATPRLVQCKVFLPSSGELLVCEQAAAKTKRLAIDQLGPSHDMAVEAMWHHAHILGCFKRNQKAMSLFQKVLRMRVEDRGHGSERHLQSQVGCGVKKREEKQEKRVWPSAGRGMGRIRLLFPRYPLRQSGTVLGHGPMVGQ